MEYTIQKAAAMAGLSTRTLRYYEEIGLLAPLRKTEAGYRVYGPKELNTLQQILFYRELGMKLTDIKAILSDPSFDRRKALTDHLEALLGERERLGKLINTVKKTLKEAKGELYMKEEEKFEGFKRELIQENEEKYGAELREKYGPDVMEQANRKLLSLDKEAYDRMQELEKEILKKLEVAVKEGSNPAGEQGKEIAALHREWLSFTWPSYTREAHLGVVELYVLDPRFTSYYDKAVPGCAAFLKDAVKLHI